MKKFHRASVWSSSRRKTSRFTGAIANPSFHAEQFANINGNNNQLDPNTFSNLEAGVKVDFSQGLSLTASIFEVEQSSPQVADDDPETLDVIDSEISGFELQPRSSRRQMVYHSRVWQFGWRAGQSIGSNRPPPA